MGLRIIHDEHEIDVPPAIEAEGAHAVTMYVAEEIARAEAIAESTAQDATHAEGADQ